MTAKQYLSQLEKLEIQIDQLMKEKSFLDAQLTSTTIRLKDINVLSHVQPDPMADRVIRLIEIEEKLDRKTDRLIDLRMTIVSQIQSLPNALHIQILYKRFVEYKRCNDVFAEICKEHPEHTYSDRQLYRAYDAALVEFRKKFLKDVSKCQ